MAGANKQARDSARAADWIQAEPEILRPGQGPKRSGFQAGLGGVGSGVRFGSAPGDHRWGKAGQLLSDERLHWLEVVLDEAFRIPGTNFRFGIDGIIGLIPGLGDVLAGLLSLVIPLAAWIRGVPYITLVRMLANLAIGVLVGSIPVVGDAFDVFWKPNKRNYRLLARSLAAPRKHTWRDWLFLLGLALCMEAVLAVPIVLVVWIMAKVLAWGPIH